MRACLCLVERQKKLCLNEAEKSEKGNCVCVCVFRSQSCPIYLGGIISETAPFLDATIIHAGQGLRCEAPPYIKVSPINTD